MNALTPYKKLLTMTKEAIDVVMVPVRSAQAKKRAELEVLKLDEALAKHELELTELCSKREIDFEAIIQKLDAIALTERRQKQFKKIITEMFPE